MSSVYIPHSAISPAPSSDENTSGSERSNASKQSKQTKVGESRDPACIWCDARCDARRICLCFQSDLRKMNTAALALSFQMYCIPDTRCMCAGLGCYPGAQSSWHLKVVILDQVVGHFRFIRMFYSPRTMVTGRRSFYRLLCT